jgi:uncharacterized membrane protein YfcA
VSVTEGSLAFLLAMVISALTVPAGVSGAVFLLPAQLSLLGMPNPAVTPTNLVYNAIATPAALLRYRGQGQIDSRLVRPVMVGALPGVAVGAVLRTTVASGAGTFRVLVGLLLVVLGARLLATVHRSSGLPRQDRPRWPLIALGGLTGTIGGLYGIGGGSVLAPLLAIMGFALADVAAAALTVTFSTSVAGVLAFSALALLGRTEAAPDWAIGITLGLGGLVGGYLGARWQPYLQEKTLRRILGGLAMAVGLSYLVVALA